MCTASEIMAVYGHVGEFDRDTDDWKSYIEQMDCFFDANGIDKDDRKRAILLSSCGSQTYRLLRSLVSSVKPDTKPYKEIVKILNDYFSPEPSITLQRYKFNSKSREKDQSVASFAADLRQISEYCNFADKLK